MKNSVYIKKYLRSLNIRKTFFGKWILGLSKYAHVWGLDFNSHAIFLNFIKLLLCHLPIIRQKYLCNLSFYTILKRLKKVIQRLKVIFPNCNVSLLYRSNPIKGKLSKLKL